MIQCFDPDFAGSFPSFAIVADLARKELAADWCCADRSNNDANRRIAVTPRARTHIPRGCDFRPEAMKGASFNDTRLTA